MSERDTSLTIGYNNCATNDPCAICGGRSDPSIPLAIIVGGTHAAVCDPCAERCVPELLWLLRHFYRTVTELDHQSPAYEAEIQKLIAEVSAEPDGAEWF